MYIISSYNNQFYHRENNLGAKVESQGSRICFITYCFCCLKSCPLGPLVKIIYRIYSMIKKIYLLSSVDKAIYI